MTASESLPVSVYYVYRTEKSFWAALVYPGDQKLLHRSQQLWCLGVGSARYSSDRAFISIVGTIPFDF